LIVLSSLCLAGYAQTPVDTLNLRHKYFTRQAAYEAHQAPFPPPRKNNWSFGVQLGTSIMSGDIRPLPGYGIGLNLRKALSHAFSLRLQGSLGSNGGLDWRPNTGFTRSSALNGVRDPRSDYTSLPYPFVYYNFKTNYFDAGLQGILHIGNISFHDENPKVNLYTFAGFGGMLYNTRVNALDANEAKYDYSNVGGGQALPDRRDVLRRLDNLLDDTYETAAEEHPSKPKWGSSTLLPVAHLGLGLEFKVSRRFSLSLEHRVTWTGDDLVDGHRWEDTQTLTANADYVQYSSVGFNLRLGKGEESYWFQNPLTLIYNDVRDLERRIETGNKDSDHDGVTDAYDKEPGSPEGVMADGHGRAVDSDGDGLQDFRDREPFSSSGAEVDDSGIALDSDDDGVIDLRDAEPNSAPGSQSDAKGRSIATVAVESDDRPMVTNFGMVNFDLNSAEVKQEYYPVIYQVAKFMNENPSKSIVVIGNSDNRGDSDANVNLSKVRATNVAKILNSYMGVAPERIRIDHKGSGEQLVNNLPADHQDPRLEALQFLNRRVEFRVAE
jgi:outer membrane protein OmpA-like peptidoglycan-associated protein